MRVWSAQGNPCSWPYLRGKLQPYEKAIEPSVTDFCHQVIGLLPLGQHHPRQWENILFLLTRPRQNIQTQVPKLRNVTMLLANSMKEECGKSILCSVDENHMNHMCTGLKLKIHWMPLFSTKHHLKNVHYPKQSFTVMLFALALCLPNISVWYGNV